MALPPLPYRRIALLALSAAGLTAIGRATEREPEARFFETLIDHIGGGHRGASGAAGRWGEGRFRSTQLGIEALF
jgi:hypothetical protein